MGGSTPPYPNPTTRLSTLPNELGRACVDYIEKTIFRHLVSPTEVGGIFVETIQGEGGYVVPTDDFYPALRDLCDRYEIPLVLDEVQSGFGRTGKMFAIAPWGIEPDVMCFAKGIASGMPMGAIVARKSIIGGWTSGAHANTYGGNALAVAASLANIRLLEEGLTGNARDGRLHPAPRQRLARPLLLRRRRARQGLMIGVEIVKDKSPRGRPRLARPHRGRVVQARPLLLGAGPTPSALPAPHPRPPPPTPPSTSGSRLDTMRSVIRRNAKTPRTPRARQV